MEGRRHEELRHQLARADAAYSPFAPFAVWAAEPVGLGPWIDAVDQLADARMRTPVDVVRTALREPLRAAAVDTGAVEGLYATDRGFTRSVARNVISLDQAEIERGPEFRRSFEAQLAAFEMVEQLATGGEVLTEASVRELHRVTCAGQPTHRVLTPVGVQERRLVLGSYKVEPNHVLLGNGSFHSYAPVDLVSSEMHRLIEELRSSAFLDAPAVVQAAFAHHALTAVHPFGDGNGRVARLVASVWLLRSASIPLWVEPTDRDRYFDALADADRGERGPFLRFITSLTLRLLRELTLVLAPALDISRPDAEALIAARVAEVIADQVRLALAPDRAASVLYPHPVRPGGPPNVRIPSEEAAVVFNAAGTPTGPGSRAVALGVDHGAEAEGRFCVLVYQGGGTRARLVLRHDFGADELGPEISPSASRRLSELVRLAVESSREEHPARR